MFIITIDRNKWQDGSWGDPLSNCFDCKENLRKLHPQLSLQPAKSYKEKCHFTEVYCDPDELLDRKSP